MRVKVGFRTFKTGIAVALTVAVTQWLGIGNGFFGAVAAVIALQSTIADSVRRGKERLMGTFIGAVVGLLFSIPLYMNTHMNSDFIYGQQGIWVGLGIIVVIICSNLLQWKDSIVLGSIVFSAIILNGSAEPNVIYYSVMRFVETFIGIVFGVMINYFIKPPKVDKRVTETIMPLGAEIFELFMIGMNGYFYGNIDDKEVRQKKSYIDGLFTKTNNYILQLQKETAYRTNYDEDRYKFEDVVKSYNHLYDHAKSAIRIAQAFNGAILEVYPHIKDEINNLLELANQLEYYVSQPLLEEKVDLINEFESALEDIKIKMQTVFFKGEKDSMAGMLESFTILYHVERFIAHMKDF